MAKIEFNLIDEPWIRVNCLDGEREMVLSQRCSLRAHEFSGLAGEMPTQDVAILRTLLAVTMTVFYRVNEVGEPAPLRPKMTHWSVGMHYGQIAFSCRSPLLTTSISGMSVFGFSIPSVLFMQAISAANGTDCGTPKLIGEISESGSKPRLFACRAGEGKEKIPL